MNGRPLLRVIRGGWLWEDRMRCEAFKSEHPGARVYHVGDMQQAVFPYGDREVTLTRETLRELLDDAEEFFRADPG